MNTITGNVYDKYNTKNPIARLLTGGFLRSFDALARRVPAGGEAYEIGCGEGNLAIRLARSGLQVTAADITDEILEVAARRAGEAGVEITFEKKSVYELSDLHSKALLVCCEVLEHLQDPHQALRIMQAAGPNHVLLSIPREPIWRILNLFRGKYLARLGNTPGHVQHWSKAAFLQTVSEYFRILEVRSPLPWTMVLARPA